MTSEIKDAILLIIGSAVLGYVFGAFKAMGYNDWRKDAVK